MTETHGIRNPDGCLPERGFDVHVTRITLFRSHLGFGGARYEQLYTAPMA